MIDNRSTLRLTLNGDVPLNEFADAIEHFRGLVTSLSDEVAGPGVVEWEVADLQAGSATTVVRAVSDESQAVARIITAYDVVAEALQRNHPIPYSPEVEEHARALTHVLNGHITSMVLSTSQIEHTIGQRFTAGDETTDRRHLISWGAVHGELGTITARPRLRITVFDKWFNKAVYCFPSRQYEAVLREAWGKTVRIAGKVHRDPNNGRPLRVTDVVEIAIVEPKRKDTRLRARGILQNPPEHPLPETIIRLYRDA